MGKGYKIKTGQTAPKGTQLTKIGKKRGLAPLIPQRVMPQRLRSVPIRLHEQADEADLMEIDPDIDILEVPEEVDDDFDWLPHVPGRPPPFRNTWSTTYGHRVVSGLGFLIPAANPAAVPMWS